MMKPIERGGLREEGSYCILQTLMVVERNLEKSQTLCLNHTTSISTFCINHFLKREGIFYLFGRSKDE